MIIESKSPNAWENCAKKDIPTYTGTSLIGISVMHKSSLVPVFDKQNAIDIAKMRRG